MDGKVYVIVVLDVMIWGMDVEGVVNVINYDVFVYVKIYVYCVGCIVRVG